MTRKKYIDVPCSVVEEGATEPCGNPSEVLKHKMCFAHYRRMQRYGNAAQKVRKAYRTPKHLGCQGEPGCVEEVRSISHGVPLCNRHNTRLYRLENIETIKRQSARNRKLRRKSDGSHTQGELDDLLAAHGGRCLYCGAQLERITRRFGRDHAIPISRGGSDYIENIAPSCPPCNYSKRDKTITEYRDYLNRVSQLSVASSS